MKPLWLRQCWFAFSETFPSLAYDILYRQRYHHWEPDLWLVPGFCRMDSTVVDVGANMGIYSRYMAKHSKNVHSFECNPQLLPALQRILPKNAKIHSCALSSVAGQAKLRFDPNNTGIGTIEPSNRLDNNSGIKEVIDVEVDVRRLDDFELSNVTFVKIDVEGHELEVLRGARELIERCRPVFLIEIEERHCPGNLAAVPAWLADFGYRASVLGEDGRLVSILSIEELANKSGVNNFWFISDGYVNAEVSRISA